MKKLLLALLLAAPFVVFAKPIGFAMIDDSTAVVLTDEDCPEEFPIGNLVKQIKFFKKGEPELSGCYAILTLNSEHLVVIFVDKEKQLIFLPLHAFTQINSLES